MHQISIGQCHRGHCPYSEGAHTLVRPSETDGIRQEQVARAHPGGVTSHIPMPVTSALDTVLVVARGPALSISFVFSNMGAVPRCPPNEAKPKHESAGFPASLVSPLPHRPPPAPEHSAGQEDFLSPTSPSHFLVLAFFALSVLGVLAITTYPLVDFQDFISSLVYP